jgi:hypothetical protein
MTGCFRIKALLKELPGIGKGMRLKREGVVGNKRAESGTYGWENEICYEIAACLCCGAVLSYAFGLCPIDGGKIKRNRLSKLTCWPNLKQIQRHDERETTFRGLGALAKVEFNFCFLQGIKKEEDRVPCVASALADRFRRQKGVAFERSQNLGALKSHSIHKLRKYGQTTVPPLGNDYLSNVSYQYRTLFRKSCTLLKQCRSSVESLFPAVSAWGVTPGAEKLVRFHLKYQSNWANSQIYNTT